MSVLHSIQESLSAMGSLSEEWVGPMMLLLSPLSVLMLCVLGRDSVRHLLSLRAKAARAASRGLHVL